MIRYYSATLLKRHDRCPRESTIKDLPQSDAMLAGEIRHFAIQRHYQLPDASPAALAELHPKFTSLPLGTQNDIIGSLGESTKRPGFLPPKDWVLSCEASHLPEGCTTISHGRRLFQIQIGEDWGLRGAADLVVVNPRDPYTLALIDWKGRFEEDNEIQAMVYVVAYARMFPDFKFYRFESRHIPTLRYGSPFQWSESDLPLLENHLEGRVRRLESDTTHLPRRNEWCHTCPLRGDCPEYTNAIVPLVDVRNVLQARTCQLPAHTFGERIDLKRKARLAETIAHEIRDRCEVELLEDLAGGALTHDGKEYFVCDVARSRSLDETLARGLLIELGIPFEDVGVIQTKRYVLAVEKALDQLNPELRCHYERIYRQSFRRITSKEIRHRKAPETVKEAA